MEGVEPVVMTVVPTTWTIVTTWGPEQVASGDWVVLLLVVGLSEPELAGVAGIADPEFVMYVLGSLGLSDGILMTVCTITAGPWEPWLIVVACGVSGPLPLTVLVLIVVTIRTF